MKYLLAFAVITIVAIVCSSAPASAQQRAWCSVTHHGSRGCAFDTRAQCMRTISGIGGHCIQNHHPRPQQRALTPGFRHIVKPEPAGVTAQLGIAAARNVRGMDGS